MAQDRSIQPSLLLSLVLRVIAAASDTGKGKGHIQWYKPSERVPAEVCLIVHLKKLRRLIRELSI